MSRGPHLSQKAKKIDLRGPDVARRPYVAPSCSRTVFLSQRVVELNFCCFEYLELPKNLPIVGRGKKYIKNTGRRAVWVEKRCSRVSGQKSIKKVSRII